jgi:branched-chain amino acid transport system substrate-binding protein
MHTFRRKAVSRNIVISIAVVVIIVIAAGGYLAYRATQAPSTQRYITLGLSLPMSYAVGQDAYDAAQMAVSQINANGGVIINNTHYLLRTVAEDTDELDYTIPVDQGVSALQKLVTVDGAQVILGGVRTDVVVAQAAKLAQYKIVYIDIESNEPIVECEVYHTPNCPPGVTANYTAYKYYFHLFVNGTAIGPSLVKFALALKEYSATHPDAPNMSRVAVLGENALWTVGPVGRPAGNSTLFMVMSHLGFQVVYASLFPLNAQDFSTYLSQIAASKAGLIMLFFSGSDGASFMEQWQSYNWPGGMKPVVFGPGLLGGFSEFWNMTNGAAQSYITWPATVNESYTPKTVPFIDAFYKEYGHTPNTAALDMYDGVYLVAQAMHIANSWKADKLIPVLQNITYQGVIGTIHFTRSHGINLPDIPMYQQFGQWQNGVLVPVWNTTSQTLSSKFILPP